MENAKLGEVKLTGGFWKQKEDLDRKVTIHAVYNRFDDTGRIGAFSFKWKDGMPNKPHYFWDSDVAKWMEGVAYLEYGKHSPDLVKKTEKLIDEIEKNQGEDGYFNIYFTVVEPQNRFQKRGCHELYCAGHLFEAAVAYYEATGKDRFLKLMEKYADYIYRVFVEEKSASFTTPGHEEIEIGLLRMYRATKNEKWLKLAGFFLNERGMREEEPNGKWKQNYNQSHLPLREQTEAFGHAVRACYLYTGMAEYAKETGDKAMLDACKALYEDIVNRKMYVSGGIGSTFIGEAFTIPYDLPNPTAYTETCASISMIFFANAMFKNTGDAKYADTVERELYNGMLAGLSLSGDAFFYENPLEVRLSDRTRHTSTGECERLPITRRKKVFDCSCCPPNLNRVLASLGQYFYAEDGDAVYVNQFGSSEWKSGGRKVTVKTAYPENGVLNLTCENVKILKVRIPSYAKKIKASAEYAVEGGYMVFKNPTELKIDFPMEVVKVYANPKVYGLGGKVAVMRGPVLYCIESVDNGEDLHTISLGKTSSAKKIKIEGLDHSALEMDAFRAVSDGGLYSASAPKEEKIKCRLIPYADYENRGDSDMTVWIANR